MSNFLPKKLHQLKLSSVVCEEVISPHLATLIFPVFFLMFFIVWFFMMFVDSVHYKKVSYCFNFCIFNLLQCRILSKCLLVICLGRWRNYEFRHQNFCSTNGHSFNFPTLYYLCGQTLHEFIYHWEDCLCALPIFKTFVFIKLMKCCKKLLTFKAFL